MTRYENLSCKTTLNRVKAPSMPFDWSINPYRGCQHGCSFCYARSTHSFFEDDSGDTFQSHIYLKHNASEVLEDQLAKLTRSRKGAKEFKVAIGTATDPYQPIEGKAKLTRKCLEVLAHYDIPTSITTRSPLILRDLDVLQRMRISSVNISLSTLDYSLCRKLEPATPHPRQRLAALRGLREHGIRAGLFLAPIIPLIMDSDDALQGIIGAAAEHHASFVMPSYLRLPTREVKVWFFAALEREFPDLPRKYAELYGTSASLPSEYRQRQYAKIDRWLAQYGLDKSEGPVSSSGSPLSNGGDSYADKEQAPVQLSLSF